MSTDPDALRARWSLRFWDWQDRPGFYDVADAPDGNGDPAEPDLGNGES